jgi:hypothetical protein
MCKQGINGLISAGRAMPYSQMEASTLSGRLQKMRRQLRSQGFADIWQASLGKLRRAR